VLAAVATVPLALKVFRGVEKTYGDQYAMIGVMSLNVKNSAITGLLLAAGYFVGVLL
jgi:1,4-dihydroxy-2-naphthoate octaprenyltransferase